jgi:phage terminase large subunit
VAKPSIPGRRLPSLEEVRKDKSLLYTLSPQEQSMFLQALKATPTPQAQITSFADIVSPFQFFQDVLGWLPTPTAKKFGYTEGITPDQIEVVKSVVKNKYTGVTAGHGTGKTRIAAGIALWFLYTFGPNCKVITTAPTERQVKDLLWAELGSSFQKSKMKLPGELQTLAIRTGFKDWFALGFSAKPDTGKMTATNFAGFHAPYVLVILDEATGIPAEIWAGMDGIVIGPNDRVLAIGNPTDPTSEFKTRCDNPRWNHLVMDCRNHPNVLHDDPGIVPGATTKDYVEEKLEDYGGEDTPLFRAKVAGLWPDDKSDAVVPVSLLERSQALWTVMRLAMEVDPKVVDDKKGRALGLDVAREGSDLTVLSECINGILTPVKWHIGKDTTATVEMVIKHLRLCGGARAIAIDDTGVGGGVTDQLRKLQRDGDLPAQRDFKIVPVNFARNAVQVEKYNRIKDQLWWELRLGMEKNKLALPPETHLKALRFPKTSSLLTQLTTPIYVLDSQGRIDILDKRDGSDPRTVSLATKSPDIAHSLILAAWGWRVLNPQLVIETPKTTQEVVTQEFGGWAKKKLQEYQKKFERQIGLGRREDDNAGGELW